MNWEKLSNTHFQYRKQYIDYLTEAIKTVQIAVKHLRAENIPMGVIKKMDAPIKKEESIGEKLLKLLQDTELKDNIVNQDIHEIKTNDKYHIIEKIQGKYFREMLLYYDENVTITERIFVWKELPLYLEEIKKIYIDADRKLKIVMTDEHVFTRSVDSGEKVEVIKYLNVALGNEELPEQSIRKKTMYCPYCGKEIERGVKFCNFCGNKNNYAGGK